MESFELIIVFAALIAIVALAAIALDWVGKPLRGRRFIARVYRFDDELNGTNPAPPMVVPVPAPTWAPQPPLAALVDVPNDPAAAEAVDVSAFSESAFAPPSTLARGIPQVDVGATAAPATAATASGANVWDALTRVDDDSEGSSVVVASGAAPEAALEWHPGMPLDAAAGGRDPTTAVKAERFWRAAARSSSASHFGRRDRERMDGGKAPRRRNPRTGRVESMQLSGLREASDEASVRMFWPDDSVDPWAQR